MIPVTDFTLPISILMTNISREYHHIIVFSFCPLSKAQASSSILMQSPMYYNITQRGKTPDTLPTVVSCQPQSKSQKQKEKGGLQCTRGPKAKTTSLIKYFIHKVFVRTKYPVKWIIQCHYFHHTHIRWTYSWLCLACICFYSVITTSYKNKQKWTKKKMYYRVHPDWLLLQSRKA